MDGQERTTWKGLVEEGRRLAGRVSDHQWKLGDLALAVESVRVRGGIPTGVEARLNRFAEEIDVPFKTLVEYRWVASRWPANSRRLDLPWSVHHTLTSLDLEDGERAALIRSRRWRVRQAREFVASSRRTEDDETLDDFEDIEIDSLLPVDGLCPLSGVHHNLWTPLTRKGASP